MKTIKLFWLYLSLTHSICHPWHIHWHHITNRNATLHIAYMALFTIVHPVHHAASCIHWSHKVEQTLDWPPSANQLCHQNIQTTALYYQKTIEFIRLPMTVTNLVFITSSHQLQSMIRAPEIYDDYAGQHHKASELAQENNARPTQFKILICNKREMSACICLSVHIAYRP